MLGQLEEVVVFALQELLVDVAEVLRDDRLKLLLEQRVIVGPDQAFEFDGSSRVDLFVVDDVFDVFVGNLGHVLDDLHDDGRDVREIDHGEALLEENVELLLVVALCELLDAFDQSIFHVVENGEMEVETFDAEQVEKGQGRLDLSERDAVLVLNVFDGPKGIIAVGQRGLEIFLDVHTHR